VRLFRSFYARLSVIFFLLIFALGAGSLVIAFNAAGHLFDEVEQLLNSEYSSSIAGELQPLVAGGFSQEGIKDAIHYMMVLNPMVEIYLVGEKGDILAYFLHPEETLRRWSIDLAPVKEFLAREGRVPVLGDDPRTGAQRKPFSVAPLRMGGQEGYVYVILRGQSYDRSLRSLRSSYYLRTGLSTFLFALLATLLVGLSLFFLLTRRLRQLSLAVRAFEHGDLARRLDARGADELGALGRAFNDMAASIAAGVEKLKLAERQRSDLIANISHDLRSPLTAIRGHLETLLLKGYKLSEEEGRRFLDTTLKSVAGFQKLVEELFELAKLEARQAGPDREMFQLAELAQDVVLKLKPRADEAGTTLVLDQPGRLPLISADIGMIERLLTNLIENALSHTPDGGRVEVSLDSRDRTMHITVTDSGDGVDEADLPHIFERFYRADKSRGRGVPGSGLGLAIAREIVELHGGSITADSPPGSGAVFRVALPIGFPDPAVPSP
jgi:signal transduction histidine kinase